MKIGIDLSALSNTVAGIGNYCIQLVKGIYELDKENEYFLFAPTDIELPVQLNDRWHFINYGGTVNYMLKVPGILKKNKIDVFVATRHYLPPFNPGIKYLAIVHDLIPLYMPELFEKDHLMRFKFFTKLCAKKADHIIAISEATKEDVMKYMKMPESKISMIYQGADKRFSPERDEMGIKAAMEKYGITKNYVLCLSTVEPRKNMLRTIKAFHQLLLKGYTDYQLVLVGGKGWNNGEIYEYVQNQGLQENVIFTGYATDDEVKHIYANATVFAYPSLCEGFGIPIIEAMQSGTPVITSNVSCMPEVAGDACELVNPYSITDIEHAMEKIITNKALQEKYREAGFKRAPLFSWDKCAKEVWEVILKLK